MSNKLNVNEVRPGDVVNVRNNTKTYNYLKTRHRLSRNGYLVSNVNVRDKTFEVLVSQASNEYRTFPVSSFTAVQF